MKTLTGKTKIAIIAVFCCLLAFFAVGSSLAWARQFDGRIGPNTFVGPVRVSGMDPETARQAVREKIDGGDGGLFTQLSQRRLDVRLARILAALGELPRCFGVAHEGAVHEQELEAAILHPATERNHTAGALVVERGHARPPARSSVKSGARAQTGKAASVAASSAAWASLRRPGIARTG